MMKPQRAIVIGGGIAGLCAARALANSFIEVCVLERDRLPETMTPRQGVPQGKHPHGLLADGLKGILELFPGIQASLERAGGRFVDMGLAVNTQLPGYEQLPPRALGITGYAATRPLLESVLRENVKTLRNVTIHRDARATSINIDERSGSVHSVDHLSNVYGRATMPADVVVDATGRGQLTLDLLARLGRPRVAETRIGIDLRIASAVFELPSDYAPSVAAILTPARAPTQRRSGLMLWREDGYWSIGVAGRFGDVPPTDLNGFVEFSSTLATSSVHTALLNGRMVTEISSFAFPESVRRHFEQVDDFPKGLFPLGDSICRFNPVYGQGMSVAARQACILRGIISEDPYSIDVADAVERRYFEAIRPLTDSAWGLSSVPDLLFPEAIGDRPQNLNDLTDYQRKFIQAASVEPRLYQLHIEVLNLLKPATALREPRILERVRMLTKTS
jgi:2-polyprenyl-6-methoxyphenol hydroxylase-like FAD-dependent oxidoreductase